MEEINAFVDRQNVTRFRNQLGKGVENGPARNLLLDLLVELRDQVRVQLGCPEVSIMQQR